ncbi:M20/M25/M40 family metallo-hydrolase [Paracoccus sp. IB05]|uniref:M20/M25/M40 family metallo-hydrolase n=1 Tax=Paracoccus sp. IB05 TaxID=2779367 RepID=UPI0018E82650|nr:M20/M25/M40 family metallo-hydrolase [Paracoccus sp. IB05]MBJ2151633.1 M20/M25/M40 family metallo-hydrolase [Paracoccus sp. IB05]
MSDTAGPGRDATIAAALAALESGRFRDDLAARVAIPSVSTDPAHLADCEGYLRAAIAPELTALGFTLAFYRRPETALPFMLASRIEGADLPTVLLYGHGDVVEGMEASWQPGLSPFTLQDRDGRFYGRGTADNKGQHSINIAAIRALIETEGALGFNLKYLFETGEEAGSPGLAGLCEAARDDFAADVFIASDGPRVSADLPTMFLGARGVMDFWLELQARDGAVHSGNWGGLVANPAVELCHAIAALIGPTGQCLVPELTPGQIPDDIRASLAGCEITAPSPDLALDPWWGEPGLTQAERVYAWSSLEVMAISSGDIGSAVGAIPPVARARLELRFPLGVAVDGVLDAIRCRLDQAGAGRIRVIASDYPPFPASRSELSNEWVGFIATSIGKSLGRAPQIIPNFGGALPNRIFAEGLRLPTIWIPHSYPGCGQHGPDEHLPRAIAAEGLQIMAGLFWDIGHRGL